MASAEEACIANQRISHRPIDIKQGGQFIEPLCDLIPSMLAQQVAADSFEKEPPYRVAYKAEIDKPFLAVVSGRGGSCGAVLPR